MYTPFQKLDNSSTNILATTWHRAHFQKNQQQQRQHFSPHLASCTLPKSLRPPWRSWSPQGGRRGQCRGKWHAPSGGCCAGCCSTDGPRGTGASCWDFCICWGIFNWGCKHFYFILNILILFYKLAYRANVVSSFLYLLGNIQLGLQTFLFLF